MKHVVSISDAKVAKKPGDELITYSLGSCIGMAVYDANAKIGGLLHYQLPSATINPDRAAEMPYMFADSGLDKMLKELAAAGANCKRLKVKIAGAAEMLNDAGVFNIGKRNHAAARKILWKKGLFLEREDVGGKIARTMSLLVDDGSVIIASQGRKVQL